MISNVSQVPNACADHVTFVFASVCHFTMATTGASPEVCNGVDDDCDGDIIVTISFFEQFKPGTRLELGQYTFSESEIIRFAKKFDPQPFHLSQGGAASSHFGRLCASGWHTASIWMKLNVTMGVEGWCDAVGYSGPLPEFGPSPGLRNLKWLHPVYAGDTISYLTELTEKRLHPRRDGWALLSLHNSGKNQNGRDVLSFDSAVLLKL